jgi:hypothetical protein
MEQLRGMIRSGEFKHQLHLGVVAVAAIKLEDW